MIAFKELDAVVHRGIREAAWMAQFGRDRELGRHRSILGVQFPRREQVAAQAIDQLRPERSGTNAAGAAE